MRFRPRDPFARKMVQGSFAFACVLLVMFAVLTAVYLHTRPRCSDRVMGQADSPGARWIATILEGRCGEDAAFFTHVNLRPAGSDLTRGFFSGSATEGEVFHVEQDAAVSGINLHWSAPDTLVIQCPHCEASLLRKHDERWNGVSLKYELASRATQR